MTAAAKLATDTNEIADIRRTLCEQGYLFIPVKDKGPRIKGWSRKRYSAAQVDGTIRNHADHQRTGILCGNDLVAIDIDAPTQAACDNLIARLMEIPTAANAPRRTGKAPKCLFLFRAAAPGTKGKTSEFTVDGQKHQVEILRDGQQFVAFGDHVETGRPYTWANGSPLDIRPEDLPVITNDEISALLQDAEQILAGLGERVKEEPKQPRRDTGGKSFWQQVNSAALANLDKWVPALFSGAKHQSATGAWRISSEELGRALEEDISIHPDGVQDFGREKPATPINLVEEYGNAPTAKAAALWLCEQMGIAPAELGWENRQAVTISFGQSLVAPSAANDDFEIEEYRSDTPLADLTRPGGFVEELIDWIVSSAENPSRELALSAVLPFVGALVGRRFSGYRDARTNVYSIALAPSGYGKDHARQQIKRLIAAANLHAFSGPARLMSASGLRAALMDKPSCCCMIDEIGGPLREMLSSRANPHQSMIKTDMLDYFSAASTYFDGAAYAQVKAVRLETPNLCIYGTSTPDDFWNAISSGSTRDGFIARLLLFNIEGHKPKLGTPSLTVGDVPQSIRERAKLLGMAGRDANMDSPGLDKGERPRVAIPVPMSPGADKRRAEFRADIDKRLKRADGPNATVLNRAVEHAVKLALIVAVATEWRHPMITERQMAWACQVSWLSCCALMKEASLNVADNQREQNVQKILRLLRDAGEKGMLMGQITRHAPGIEKRQRGEILEDLSDSGQIIGVEQKATTKGGRPSWRLWLREKYPQKEAG
jgi:hypothetical protein